MPHCRHHRPQPWYRPPASLARTPGSRSPLAYSFARASTMSWLQRRSVTACIGKADSHVTDHAARSRRGTIAARAFRHSWGRRAHRSAGARHHARGSRPVWV